MSDHHQDIVAPDIPESVAAETAAKLVRWLHSDGVIAKGASGRASRLVRWLRAEGVFAKGKPGCAMDSDAEGYAPGPRWAAAAEGDRDFLKLKANRVEVVTTRTVFDTGGNGIELTCQSCHQTFEPGDAYIEAIDAWWEGDDNTAYGCDRCGHTSRLADWTGPFAFGFGNVGLRFWNWPPLRGGFVEAVARVVGSRVIVVRCHV